MKTFTTIQVGYSHSDLFGVTNEYFTTIYTVRGSMKSFSYQGMYGSEERIARAMKEKGYNEIYTPSDYGIIPIRKHWKGFLSEKEALDLIRYIK